MEKYILKGCYNNKHRYYIFLCIYFLSINTLFSQDIIMLTHSVGGAVYDDGDIPGWFDNYNTINRTSYNISRSGYPADPYTWNNNPYDYWNIWVNGDCFEDKNGQKCLESFTDKYDVIVFKHCYTAAEIEEDISDPDVSSDRKSIENYKLQYKAIKNKLDLYPDTKFIIWTLAPRHRLKTDANEASRAKTFVDWVKTEWLQEDGKTHNNIFIFDFWNLVAETNHSPKDGELNCLKYEYEKDHSSNNSHPNSDANKLVGPIVADFIVKVIENPENITRINKQKNIVKFYPNPNYSGLFLITPTINDIQNIVIYNSHGSQVDFTYNIASGLLNLQNNNNGIYFVKIVASSGNYITKIVLGYSFLNKK